MARDFEDLHDLDDLSDGELRDLVRQHLASHNALDIDDLVVRVEEGTVYLEGRVGTDEEQQVAEHVVTDVLGISSCVNNIFIDPVRRTVSPEAIDDHLADESRREGLLLGDVPEPRDPEDTSGDGGLDARLYGTSDVQTAISEGTAWIPPESPTPEGFSERGELGEDH